MTIWKQLRAYKNERDSQQERASRLITIANGDKCTLTLARMSIITAIKAHQSIECLRLHKRTVLVLNPVLIEEPRIYT